MTWLAFTVGIVLGAPAVPLAAAAVVVYAPTLAAPLLLAVAVAGRRSAATGPVPIAVEIAAQLRAGHTLRQAVTVAARTSGMARVARLAAAGLPMDRVAAALGDGGDEATLTAAAVRMAARSGGRSASVFDALGAAMLDAEALRRERRAAAAPAVLAAWIVGGLPVGYLLFLAVDGRLVSILTSGGPVAVLTGAGSALVLAGVAAVVVQARGVDR